MKGLYLDHRMETPGVNLDDGTLVLLRLAETNEAFARDWLESLIRATGFSLIAAGAARSHRQCARACWEICELVWASANTERLH